MLKQFYLIGWFSIIVSSSLFSQSKQTKSPADWVNPLMGTESSYELSNGNTYPSISLPWGMNSWTPQTGKMGDGWVYTYQSNKIRGFKQTHQPSPWINDYGQFSILPVVGNVSVNEEKRASWFSHKAEIAKPYYYNVYLADYNTHVELSPSERCASFNISYPGTDSAAIVIDAFDNGSYIKVVPEENMIVGYSTKNSGGVTPNFKNYFVIRCSQPLGNCTLFNDDAKQLNLESKGNHIQAFIRLKGKITKPVQLWVSSSFISNEQALRNLKEIDNKPFTQTKDEAKQQWDNWLGRIKVDESNPTNVATFYSCLYRTFLFPRKLYEINSAGQKVHYSPFNGKTEQGILYTDNGFWDTFRAEMPLINLIAPSIALEIQEGLINTYKESGWLPEWASPGHRECMIGSNSASIIADAWLKGIRCSNIDLLYEAILKNTNAQGPLSSVGRAGYQYYNQLGYVPRNVNINESAARTLEYAFADFAIMQLAKSLQKPQSEIDTFYKRCHNYEHLYNSKYSLMSGKNLDGTFQKNFNPFKWGDAFTEGNSLHYSWSVLHDIQGLKNLMGGSQQFVAMLDTVFALPPIFDNSYYGLTIHEIREMQIIGMGNYAHGNQPIQHMPYLYNYAGQPWKSQFHIREIMNKLYLPIPDGYCGDEDNGQTSAWYVFSALGFYPVTPASGQYVIGSPLFKNATLTLENGKTITIEAPDNNDRSIYIEKIKINNQTWNHNYLDHNTLTKGTELKFTLSETPNYQRGTNPEDYPFSLSISK